MALLYGPAFVAWWATLWATGGVAIYGSIELLGFDGLAFLKSVGLEDRLPDLDTSNWSSAMVNVPVAVALNEVAEVVRLPIAAATTPMIKRRWDAMYHQRAADGTSEGGGGSSSSSSESGGAKPEQGKMTTTKKTKKKGRKQQEATTHNNIEVPKDATGGQNLANMSKAYGPIFLAWWTGAWVASGVAIYGSIELLGVDGLALINYLGLSNMVDTSGWSSSMVNVPIAIGINEAAELVRFPIVVATTPMVKRLYDSRAAR